MAGKPIDDVVLVLAVGACRCPPGLAQRIQAEDLSVEPVCGWEEAAVLVATGHIRAVLSATPPLTLTRRDWTAVRLCRLLSPSTALVSVIDRRRKDEAALLLQNGMTAWIEWPCPSETLWDALFSGQPAALSSGPSR